jgi:hypothetical protein
MKDPAEQRAKRAAAKRLEARGRRVGAVAGSWISDLAELQKVITLCWQCDPKWKRSAKQHGYDSKRWMSKFGGVWADCDGCREFGPQRTCYIHMANIDQVL